MSLKEKLQNDLTDAMRARDEVRSSTIRMVLTAIKNEEVAGKEARDLRPLIKPARRIALKQSELKA